MHTAIWLLLGVCIGLLNYSTTFINEKGGLSISIVLASIGAVLGGVLGTLLFGQNGNITFASFSLSVIVSLCLLVLGKSYLIHTHS